jgi:uncharacterized protein YaaQ
MLLLLAIVQSEDAPDLSKRLMEQGLRLTQINSSGGLFGSGSVALLLGIDEASYNLVLDAIVATCQTRTKHISAVATPEPSFFFFTPMEVEVGGAIVFGVPVERFIQVSGNSLTTPTRADDTSTDDTSANGTNVAGSPMVDAGTGHVPASALSIAGHAKGASEPMKLIVAIVQGEDADDVIRAMLASGHRLTRINTTGGFLRRGNATLLIGVKAQQVEEVIGLIQSTCRRRTESAPIEKGIPAYAATIFVLDASHFIRI